MNFMMQQNSLKSKSKYTGKLFHNNHQMQCKNKCVYNNNFLLEYQSLTAKVIRRCCNVHTTSFQRYGRFIEVKTIVFIERLLIHFHCKYTPDNLKMKLILKKNKVKFKPQ